MKVLAEYVTPKFAVHWKSIGRFLGIPEGRLEILGEDYSRDVQRCCNEMLSVWLDLDQTATWEKVLGAVDRGRKCIMISWICPCCTCMPSDKKSMYISKFCKAS